MITPVSRIKQGSYEALRLINASLAHTDEVSMMSKYTLNAVDDVLRRLCKNYQIFGGKTVLLGGDFRQTANVVMRGTRNDTVEASIKCSYLWKHVTTYKLSENIRCQGQSEFTDLV